MARSKSRAKAEPGQGKAKDAKLSLYGLSIEDALRAAAQTGRPGLIPKPNRPKWQRKKRTTPGSTPSRAKEER
jgi:hypothetical protein